MAPALAQLNCEVIQSTSDEAPGLLAYIEHALGAHHLPDLFHVQHELSKAVCTPMGTQERAADKALSEAQERLDQAQAHLESTGDKPEQRGPGRPAKEPMGLEQAQQALDAARHEHDRLAQQREQVKQSIRAIGQAYHFVDLERGMRRNGQLIADDIRAQIETIRTVAQHAGLRPTWLERIHKAERVVPKLQATLEVASG